MSDLFIAYNIETILTILIVCGASLYGLIKAICWGVDRYKNNHVTLPQRVTEIERKIELLNDSDMAKTRGEFIKQHNYFMHKGTIDNLSLSYLHELLETYERRNGDGYVHKLMEDLDSLEIED